VDPAPRTGPGAISHQKLDYNESYDNFMEVVQ
jgi:hypothetical protein